MPAKRITREDCVDVLRIVALYVRRGYALDAPAGFHETGAKAMAARSLNISPKNIRSKMQIARERYGLTIENIDQIERAGLNQNEDRPDPIAILERHTQANADYIEQRRLKPAVFMVRPEPFVVAFIGDPHLSNAGCNLQAFQDDLALLAATKTRAVQMGDLLDNFHRAGPKLAAKEAQNRMSIAEALSVSEWAIAESGVKWDAVITGNHDAWTGDEGVHLLRTWCRNAKSRLFDWNARLIYRWGPGENDFHHVAASHDFKGHSQYNPLHGPGKMALWDGSADTYVAAHRHNHAEMKMPNGWRGKSYQLVRVRGYKDFDSHSEGRAQFPSHFGMEGRSAALVINPMSETHDGRQKVFMDLGEGIEYCQMLKRRGE